MAFSVPGLTIYGPDFDEMPHSAERGILASWYWLRNSHRVVAARMPMLQE